MPLLAVAVVVFWLFWWLSRHVGNRRLFYERLSASRLVQDLLGQTVRGAVMLTGVEDLLEDGRELE